MFNIKTIQRIFCHISVEDKVKIISLIPLTLTLTLLEIMGIYMIIPIIQIYSSTPSDPSNNNIISSIIEFLDIDIKIFTLMLLCILFITSVCKLSVLKLNFKISDQIAKNIINRVYRKLLNRDYEYYNRSNIPDLINKINYDSGSVNNIINAIVNLVSSIIVMIVISSAVIGINFLLFILMSSVLFVIYLILYLYTGKRVKILRSEMADANRNILRVVHDSLVSIKSIIVNMSQNYYYRIFYKNNSLYYNSASKISFLMILPKYIYELLATLFIFLYILLLIINDGMNISNVGYIGVGIILLQKIIPTVQSILSSLITYESNIKSLNNFFDVADYDFFKIKNIVSKEMSNSVVINDVTYYSDKNLIIKNLNFAFPLKGLIGICGASGSGKSTLLNLILGIIKPTKGVIEYNSSIVNGDGDLVGISYLPQDIILINDTLINNIVLFSDNDIVNYDYIYSLINKFNLEDFDYNSEIGENGKWLSGGQRQRIAIIRSLYKKSSVLILDEPTSSLDQYNCNLVMNQLKIESKNKCIIVVTHNNEYKSYFDEILYL